jgi:hypothetical protein
MKRNPCIMPTCNLKHIRAPNLTTIRLKEMFLAQIDKLAKKAGQPWQEWAVNELANLLERLSTASWLRVRCLIQSSKGANHGD